jgi:hypothetical protein
MTANCSALPMTSQKYSSSQRVSAVVPDLDEAMTSVCSSGRACCVLVRQTIGLHLVCELPQPWKLVHHVVGQGEPSQPVCRVGRFVLPQRVVAPPHPPDRVTLLQILQRSVHRVVNRVEAVYPQDRGLRRRRFDPDAVQQPVERLRERRVAFLLKLLSERFELHSVLGGTLHPCLGISPVDGEDPGDLARIGKGPQRRLRHRVDSARRRERLDVERVRQRRVLDRRAGPQQPLGQRTAACEPLPPVAGQQPAVCRVCQLGARDAQTVAQVVREPRVGFAVDARDEKRCH